MIRIALSIVVAGLLLASPAQAQSWPAKPIKLVVPFAPGGSADTLGRIVAQALTDSLGQQVYVENRGGAGGVVASGQVARADADGYTLVVSGVASHVIAPALNPKTGYDPVRDFTHIAYLGGPPIVWVVHPSTNARNLDQLLAYIRGLPAALNYGSPGPGTQGHLVAAYLANKLNLRMSHVPYKGAGPAMLDLVAGHIKMSSNTWTTALGHIKAGTVVPIAVTSAQRLPGFDVPTFKELGHSELVATTWFSISAPAGLPKHIVERLNRDIVKALDLPEVRKRMAQEGMDVIPMDAAAFTKFVEAEVTRWTPMVKASGARTE